MVCIYVCLCVKMHTCVYVCVPVRFLFVRSEDERRVRRKRWETKLETLSNCEDWWEYTEHTAIYALSTIQTAPYAHYHCTHCTPYAHSTHNMHITHSVDALNVCVCTCSSKPSAEEMRLWAETFECLMRNPAGRNLFREFLRTEYSEDNMLFWLACEDLRQEHSNAVVQEKARLIYENYVSILSPKEVANQSVRIAIPAANWKLHKLVPGQSQNPCHCTTILSLL